MIELSSLQRQGIADALEGTSGLYDDGICEQHGLEREELEQVAEAGGVVRCAVCGWWVSLDETTDDEFGEPACDECVDR